jgi:hypothetical protein
MRLRSNVRGQDWVILCMLNCEMSKLQYNKSKVNEAGYNILACQLHIYLTLQWFILGHMNAITISVRHFLITNQTMVYINIKNMALSETIRTKKWI